MITADDALIVAAPRVRVPVDLGDLDDRERAQLDYLDATIESAIYGRYAGGVFDVKVSADLIEPKVAHALKARYEAGGWVVGVLTVEGDAGLVAIQMVFAPGRVTVPEGVVAEVRPKVLPLLAAAGALNVARAPRLLVRFPTRQRPIQALSVLQNYREMAGRPIDIEIILDEDDETMLRAEVLQRLAALGCVVTVGSYKSKVEACNGGRVGDWDVMMLASDDMVPVADGWAVRVASAMGERWPHLDGAIYFDDGYQRSHLCTLPILGRRLYDQFGYVYAPEYKSLYCDREQTELLRAMGRLSYVDEKIIEHRHHEWGRAERDALYQRNDAFGLADRETYESRKQLRQFHAQWAFDSPAMWLSILICSLPERRARLDGLLDDLYAQNTSEIEILVDDREGATIGEKRQALLERARGHFVAFVDDDDGVAHDYCRRMVETLGSQPDADCASLVGVMTTDGARPERFEHSIEYDHWHTERGVHRRCPNHLNPIRRELALRVGFAPKNHGEDVDFSARIRPLLKKEASTGDRPLYYYWWCSNKTGER
jgi:hypothetical protein